MSSILFRKHLVPLLIPRPLKFILWAARIWSLIVVIFWLLIFVPDTVSQPIASEDWFLLGFLGLAPLGLLIGREDGPPQKERP